MIGIPVIGLVGGVGSGKSSVARAAATQGRKQSQSESTASGVAAGMIADADIVIVSGDEAGHRVLEQEDVQSAVREAFGNSVFDASGRIVRAALARRVFGKDAEQQRARKALEKIVHPAIQELLKEQIETAALQPGVRAVLLDAAVLFEAKWNAICDAVVFIDSSPAERLHRVQVSRGWSESELRNREESQWPLDQKRKAANFVVSNSEGLESAGCQLRAIVEQLISWTSLSAATASQSPAEKTKE